MALESGTYIKDLVSANPPGSDSISQGDDHLRLIKSTIQASFPSNTSAPTVPNIAGNGNKFLQVNSGATATAWATVRTAGSLNRATFAYKDADEIYISSGEYDLDGTTTASYSWDSQLTFQIGSGGSNAASSAAGTSQWQYLYMDDSAISASPLVAASFLNATTGPTYNQSKHGWYNGSDRCIFAFYIDSAGDIEKWFHDGGDYVMFSTNFNNGRTAGPNIAYQAITILMPSFATKAECNVYIDGQIASARSYQYWRVTGSGGEHLLGRIEDDDAEYVVNNVTIYTDSSRQIDVLNNTAPSVYPYTAGWFIPGGM
jgi:hypothetical protein